VTLQYKINELLRVGEILPVFLWFWQWYTWFNNAQRRRYCFHDDSCYANALQCYDTHALSVLYYRCSFNLKLVRHGECYGFLENIKWFMFLEMLYEVPSTIDWRSLVRPLLVELLRYPNALSFSYTANKVSEKAGRIPLSWSKPFIISVIICTRITTWS
jgi:hypothetical protein